MVPHGIGAVPNRIGLRSTLPARARALNGWVKQGRDLCGGIVRILQKLFESLGGRRRPPEGGSASPKAKGGVMPHGIGAMPDEIGSRSDLPTRARARSGPAWWIRAAASAGASLEFYERSLSRWRPPLASGGWLGLSGGQGRRVEVWPIF